MEVEFLLENITPYTGSLLRVLSPHSQIPVLSSVLVEATEKGLSFSVTDLEFGTQHIIPAKIEKEGGVLVPGKQFLEVLSSLAQGKATLSQEKDTIKLQTQKNKFTFQCLPKDEFPKLYEDTGKLVLKQEKKSFDETFSRLIFAVSQDEARPHLTGVCVKVKNQQVEYVATDGYRLSLVRTKGQEEVEAIGEGIILSPRLITEGLSIKETGEIKLYINEENNQAILQISGTTLVGRLIEGVYPDYERVLPKNLSIDVEVDSQEFSKSLKTVSVFARENANVVNLRFEQGTLYLGASSGTLGDAEVSLDTKQAGDDVTISFNIKFLLDLLRVFEDKGVRIRLNSSTEPALFEPLTDKGFLHVIMPVRVQD